MKIVYGEHCLTPKHGCSPEVILVFLSLQPSWGSVNSSPARVYTVVNNFLLHFARVDVFLRRMKRCCSSIFPLHSTTWRSEACAMGNHCAWNCPSEVLLCVGMERKGVFPCQHAICFLVN